MDAYGLTGCPLGHSVSPEIHRRIFELEQIPFSYDLYPVTPDMWEEKLPVLFQLRGFNITLPYKQRILQSLDRLHESAAFYGAANTVQRMDDGTHVGYNTDCDGFLHTMECNGIAVAGRVCVLGAGGVGRMFALESARQGAQVTVAVRESGLGKAKALAREAQEELGACIEILDIAALEQAYDLMIHATPVGMYPNLEACPVSEKAIEKCAAVFDCIYNPVETKLMQIAKKCGAKTVGGTAMLVWQAVAAHQYWHAKTIAKDAVMQMIPAVEIYIANQYKE